MSDQKQSKRFTPNKLAEKLVPVILILLVVILLTVFVVLGLSLAGIIPAK